MSHLNARTVFDAMFLLAGNIEFNTKWSNSTGYYDDAINVKLEAGDIVRFVSPMPNNRKGIIFNTTYGNVVVFERYTNGANDVFVSNSANEVSAKIGYNFGMLSGEDIMVIAASAVHDREALPELILVDNINAAERKIELCEYVISINDGHVVRLHSDKKLYLFVKDSRELDFKDSLKYETRYYAVAGQKIDQQCVTEEQVINALVGK